MRRLLFILLLLVQIALAYMAIYMPEVKWALYTLGALGLLLLLLLFRSVIKPAHTVRYGLELIAAQDFNNRLVKVGEPESDRVVKLFNTMIDKLRNERLQNLERESFLQLLVEESPMGVAMLDFDGRISLMNPSFKKMLGLDGDKDYADMKIATLPSEFAGRIAEVPLGVSEIIRRGDISRYRCYHLSFIQSGFRRQFYLLESLTEEVMKAERSAYEKVIRIISHEVNNTMGGVRSVLDMLQEVVEGDEIREVIDSCDNRCDQMTRFISSYADVVRVPDPVKTTVSLNDTLAEMIPFLQGMLSPGMELDFIPSAEEIKVDLDLSLMQQVIVNIVKNAKESFPEDSNNPKKITIATSKQGFPEDNYNSKKITIATSKQGNRARLEISNNGLPISDKVSAQLFSPFFTTKREGRGIGLTLISEILNRHSADYSLKTASDGITRFTILL